MISGIERCMGCMTLKSSEGGKTPDKCPHCGFEDSGVYPAPYLEPRTVLANRYIVGRLISYNGEAALYEGFDTLADTRVIIKEYMPDALCTREKGELSLSVNSGELPLYKTYLSEFVELNRSLQSLNSTPGIQKTVDVFSDNATAYAIYEHINGVYLSNFIENSGGRISHKQVSELFFPVLKGLSRINAAGIIHRGISPTTAFVELEGKKAKLYLTNFAITAARTFGTKLNSEVFPGYAAPEQHNTFERHGGWTDVYGFSCLAYTALTGITPTDSIARLNGDNVIEPVKINADIPLSISNAVMRGMKLSLDERVNSAGELLSLLQSNNMPSSLINTVGDTISFTKIADMPPVSSRPITPINPMNSDVNSMTPLGDGDEYSEDYNDEIDKAEIEREKKRKIKMIIALSAISVIVVVFLILTILAVAGIITPGGNKEETEPPSTTEEVTTPATEETSDILEEGQVINFVGKKFNEEWAKDERFAFLKFEFKPEYNEDPAFPYGVVTSQSIKQGKIVPKGTNIVIKYSLGPEFVFMPDYTGMKVDDLVGMLYVLGVKYENIAINDIESPAYIEPDMIDSCNIQPSGGIRITPFPNDEERGASFIIINRAIPLGGETTETATEEATTPLPTAAPPGTTKIQTTKAPEPTIPITTETVASEPKPTAPPTQEPADTLNVSPYTHITDELGGDHD